MKNLADRASILMARLLASLAVAMLVLAGASLPAFAQTYPVNNPTYIPAAVLSAQTCSAACDIVFNVNGLGSMTFRVAGAGTGISAVIQGSNDRSSSPTYTNLSVYPVGGPKITTIAATGLYRVSTQGLTSVRLHLTAVTGSITITGAGEPAGLEVYAQPPRKATYSAVAVAFSPASSPTDFLVLPGNATTTVVLTGARCTGVATAAASQSLELVLRSTADTGTAVALTAVPHDSTSPAAVSIPSTYAANPTTGTLVGVLRAAHITTSAAASTSGAVRPVEWTFATTDEQPIVLRGVTQEVALNGAGVSFGSGAALDCSLTWEEE